MLRYILRRLLYAFPILIGVNLLTFSLFFVLTSPDQMAAAQLGERRLDAASVQAWKVRHGYDRPLFYNREAAGIGHLSETVFFHKSLRLFALDFGSSYSGRDIRTDILTRVGPSFALALPTLWVGLGVNISVALLLVLVRATPLDRAALLLLVALMSVSYLFYIIGGQYLFARSWRLVPVSGFGSGPDAWRFLVLPVLIGVVSGIGAGVRWYRSLFLEEAELDYVRSARARGCGELRILFHHILPNALLPIITGLAGLLPALFLGSLLMEAFFGIPGLGNYLLEAINAQDFAIVRSMVFIGCLLYIIGLLLTDIAYTWADPRVRLR